MVWTCPACSLAISHHDSDPAPRPGVVYRCHVCRLELVLDVKAEKLTLAPLRELAPDHEPRKQDRGE
jgi:hypothetical protein